MSMKIKKSMGIMKLQKDKSFNFVKDFIKSFKKKIKYKKKIIPLHEPFFDKAEKKYVLECIKSTFVSTRGQMVKRFEEEIRKITNSKYSIAIVNGTCALHLALKLIGTKQGDEVLLPSLTFAGTSHAVLNAGAAPHFLESEYDTLGVDPKPLLMAVCFGASASFMTPMGYQTNMMVYGPGKYKFKDFVYCGLPLTIIFWIVAIYYIPKFWPF